MSTTTPTASALTPATASAEGGAALDWLAALPVADRDVARHWLDQYESPHTRAAYARDLRAWAAWLADAAGGRPWSMFDATPLAASGWARHQLDRGASTASVARRQAALSSFYRWAAAVGLVEGPNPFGTVRRVKASSRHVTPVGSAGDVARILAAAEAGPHPDRDRRLVLILATTGIRVAELAAARLGHVDRAAAELTIVGKGRKVRAVPMVPVVLAALPAEADPTAPLVAANDGGPINVDQVTRILRRLGRAAGIEGLTPHRFRAYAVTDLLDAGVPLDVVQDLVGHADPRTTRGYQTRANAGAGRALAGATLAERITRAAR